MSRFVRMIAAPLPALMQAAQCLFLGAALFCDILLIRLCLGGAFVCLVLLVAQSALSSGELAVDALGWSMLIGVFHWRACWTLLKEELHRAAPRTEDDTALLHFLYRHTGMQLQDFDRVRASGEWRHYAAGERICDTQRARRMLHLIIEGRVMAGFGNEGEADQQASRSAEMRSGDCFDLRLLNICGVYLGFPNDRFTATALDRPVLCFVVPLDALSSLFERHTHLFAFFRSLALCQLSRLYQRTAHGAEAGHVLDSFGQAEDAAWIAGARSRDFSPLRPREVESMRRDSAALARWLRRSFRPSVAAGCRHQSNPLSGSFAQASVRSMEVGGLVDMLGPGESVALLE